MSTARFVLTPRGDFSLAKAIRFLHELRAAVRGSDGDEPGRGAAPRVLRRRRLAPGRGARAPEQRRARRRRPSTARRDPDAAATAGRAHAVARRRRVGAAGRRRRRRRRARRSSSSSAACDPSASPRRTRPRAGPSSSQRIQMTPSRAHPAADVRRAAATPSSSTACASSTFPRAERLLGATSIRGLPQVKVERLHAIATAALDGRLDAATLRAAGPEQALADLQRLPRDRPVRRGARAHPRRGRAGLASPAASGGCMPRMRSPRRTRRIAPSDRRARSRPSRARWSPFRSWSRLPASVASGAAAHGSTSTGRTLRDGGTSIDRVSAIDHLDLVVTSLERSLAFYRGLLMPLGYVRVSEIVGERGEQVLYLGASAGWDR